MKDDKKNGFTANAFITMKIGELTKSFTPYQLTHFSFDAIGLWKVSVCLCVFVLKLHL